MENEKRVKRHDSGMDIPPEIIEEILLNLPVKSLLRFRRISKSWKSMISESYFIRKHFRRATLLQKRLVINDRPFNFNIYSAFSCVLSSISNQPIHNETDFVYPSIHGDHKVRRCHLICPFRPYNTKLEAFCQELWCVNVEKSLYLWNPSTGTHRQLPDPPRVVLSSSCMSLSFASYDAAVYGLCYDGDNDDYKLLKVWGNNGYILGTLLYSLTSDSWRDIHHKFPGNSLPRSNGEFVNGAFHWMVRDYGQEVAHLSSTIISFDLSTETYKEVPQPMYSPPPNCMDDYVEVTVLKGMLCVFLNYKDTAFVMWVMNDYGVKESWMIMFDIRFDRIPYIPGKIMAGKLITLTPLYLYDDGGVLIWISVAGYNDWEMLIYKYGEIVAHQKIVDIDSKTIIFGPHRITVRAGFVYVESLISPATYGPQLDSSDDSKLRRWRW